MNGSSAETTAAAQDAAAKARASRPPTWKVLLHIVRFQFKAWITDMLAVIIYRFCWQLAPGLIIRAFFDMITGQAQAVFSIWGIIALLTAAMLGRAAGQLGFVIADVPLFSEITALLRRNMLKHLLNRPGASPLPDSPGEAVSRFRNDVLEIPLFMLWVNDTLVGIVVSIVSIAMMASISLPVTVMAILPLVLTGVLSSLTSNRVERLRLASREATGKVTGFIGELFGAVQGIKVATAERNVIEHFNTINEDRRKVALRERLFTEILDSLYRNTASLGIGVILLLVGRSMLAGDFTIGDFSLFVYLLGSMSNLTSMFGMAVARYKQLNVSIDRMSRLMEGAAPETLVAPSPDTVRGPLPEVHYAAPTPEDRLETLTARGLSFRYPGSQNGIEDINLEIRRGSLTVITGRVGSGKTTLLRVLLGLLPKDSGEIYWNGEPVADPGEFFVPPRCAYTPQVPRLFSSTMRENILLGLRCSEAELLEAIHQAVMERDLEGLEDGLDSVIGPRGVKLSGGQAQRTAAARMLVRRPELLVFDDLSSALDVETERLLWERLFDNGHAARPDGTKPTCLVVSHRRPVLRRADRIIVMQNGRVAAEGTLAELLECCPEMQSLWQQGAAAAPTEGTAPAGL